MVNSLIPSHSQIDIWSMLSLRIVALQSVGEPCDFAAQAVVLLIFVNTRHFDTMWQCTGRGCLWDLIERTCNV